LLAKIIAHCVDRNEALVRLQQALASVEIVGPATNRDFLIGILKHPAFAALDIDTRFIERHQAELSVVPQPPSDGLVAAAAFVALRRLEHAAVANPDPADPFSPWLGTAGWRLGGAASRTLEFDLAGSHVAIDVTWQAGSYHLSFAGRTWSVSGEVGPAGTARIRVDDRLMRVGWVLLDDTLTLFAEGSSHVFLLRDPRRPSGTQTSAAGRIVSPMPGLVLSVTAAAGAPVEKGQPLVVIEAMKMEHTVAAPRAGRVQSVDVGVGDQVAAGAELVVLEAET
jgi:3-methylcrotonyl-CoA carboxylase alpha subunit